MMGSTVAVAAGGRETGDDGAEQDRSDLIDPWWMLGAVPTLLQNLNNSAACMFLVRRGAAIEQRGAESCRSPTPSLLPASRT